MRRQTGGGDRRVCYCGWFHLYGESHRLSLIHILFHILTVFRQLDVIPQRGIHVAFAFTILLLSQPLYEHVFKDRFAGNAGFRLLCRIIDLVMIGALWGAIWMCKYEYDHLSDNLGIAGQWAVVAGALLLIIVLEGTRRCLGYIMPALAILFFLYARFGHMLPGALGHKEYKLAALLKYLSVDLDLSLIHICVPSIPGSGETMSCP